MTMLVRRSGAGDRAAILALMDASRGEGLSAGERAARGFVQGTMDERLLTRFQEGTGVFVAEEDGALAGFAMTARPDVVTGGPPKRSLDAVAGQEPSARVFMYGPAAVDPRFQGRGVLTALLAELSRELAGRFDLGVAFVEEANEKSLAVHRHYGMEERARFTHEGRGYVVYAFPPSLFADRTGPTGGTGGTSRTG